MITGKMRRMQWRKSAVAEAQWHFGIAFHGAVNKTLVRPKGGD